jgi:hypothetical protein
MKRLPYTSATLPLTVTIPVVCGNLAVVVGTVGAISTLGRVIASAPAAPSAKSATAPEIIFARRETCRIGFLRSTIFQLLWLSMALF